MKAILVPIDGSASAKAALSVASSLAALSKASLKGLYVQDERRFFRFEFTNALLGELGIHPYCDSLRPAAEALEESEKMEDECQAIIIDFELACKKANIEGQFISESGTPIDAIQSAAKRVDLVTIGNVGSNTGTPSVDAGDTVKALLESVNVPILIVPANHAGVSKITLAYDDSPPSQRALRFVAPFAELTNMDIELLTVGDEADKLDAIQTPALDYLTNYDVDVCARRRSGNVTEEILNSATESSSSIIALGGTGSHRLREAIFGSTTEQIINRSAAATLLVS